MFLKWNCQRSSIHLVRHCKGLQFRNCICTYALSADISPIGTTGMDCAFSVWMFTCKVGRSTVMDGGPVAKIANFVENSGLRTSRTPKPATRVSRCLPCLSYLCIDSIPSSHKGAYVARKNLNALLLALRSLPPREYN